MLSRKETRITSSYHQVKAGGDLAALTGICKAVVALEDAAPGTALDQVFIAAHTAGFESFVAWLRAQDWDDLERRSALTRSAMEGTARIYCGAKAAMAIYGMGLTQHRAGVETVQMLVNLLLLRGNIGKPGAGICPVRGHSNVQGQRTVGITEKPELVPMDRLAAQFGFEPPREPGTNTVEACEAILEGKIRAFVSLGGNFVRAIPDHSRMEPAWRKLRLTVNVATKLNRTALVHGEISYLLPVRGRIEVDTQATGCLAGRLPPDPPGHQRDLPGDLP
jgi:anaerobic selenocysteine-containing dehydrogenase